MLNILIVMLVFLTIKFELRSFCAAFNDYE